MEKSNLDKSHFVYLSKCTLADEIQRIEILAPQSKFLYFCSNGFHWKWIEIYLSKRSEKPSILSLLKPLLPCSINSLTFLSLRRVELQHSSYNRRRTSSKVSILYEPFSLLPCEKRFSSCFSLSSAASVAMISIVFQAISKWSSWADYHIFVRQFLRRFHFRTNFYGILKLRWCRKIPGVPGRQCNFLKLNPRLEILALKDIIKWVNSVLLTNLRAMFLRKNNASDASKKTGNMADAPPTALWESQALHTGDVMS